METLNFAQQITAPSGTPFGGPVTLEVHDNGDYHVRFDMASTSIFTGFDYTVRAYLNAPGFPTMAFVHAGHTDANDDDPHDESGHSPLLALYWPKLKAAPNFRAFKDYSWSGVIGTLADIVDDIIEIFAGAVGASLGVVIGATAEAIGWMGATLGPGGTLGVIGGAFVFVVASVAGVGVGGAIIAGLLVGAVVCVITDLAFDSRPLIEEEKAIARQVFRDTIPLDDVILTNVGGGSGRGFTAAGVDGKIYINLGANFRHPLARTKSYPYPGQLLIHELTHAWQIAHTGFLPGLMCDMLVTQIDNSLVGDVYEFGPPGLDWSRLNPEQQGAIVDQWYGGQKHSAGYQAMDQDNGYYRYIWDNILEHNPSPTAPGNLRTSSSSLLSATGRTPTVPGVPEKMDVFWNGSDGAVRSQWWSADPGMSWPDHLAFPVTAGGLVAADSPVAAVARNPGHLDVFGIGVDGSIATQLWDGSWDHPAVAITGPGLARSDSAVAVVARAPQHLDLFWIGVDGAVAGQWDDEAPGLGWADHGAFSITAARLVQIGSGLAVLARLPQHMDVFWIGNEGAVWSTWWDGTGEHSSWTDHDAFPITSPGTARLGSPVVAVSRIPNHIDVFWIGNDDAVWTTWWDDAGEHMSWADHPAFPISPPGSVGAESGLTALARNPLQLDVFWVDAQGAVTTQAWTAGPPTGWLANGPFAITGPHVARAGSPVSAVSRAAQHLDVFWAGPDGSVITLWWDAAPGLGWADHPPFAIAGPGSFGHDASTAMAVAASATALSATLSDGHPEESAAAALRAAQALHRTDPPTDPATARDYWFQLGNALLDLIVRMRTAGHADQVTTPIDQAIAALHQAATAGANPITLAGLLRDLSIFATDAALTDLAVDAIVPAADVLRTFQPAADQQEVYHRVFWNVLFDVFSRLVTAGRSADAVAPASETVQELRNWAAAGAEVLNTADVLHTVSVTAAADGLLTPAVEAEQAAVDLLHPFQPAATNRENYLFFLARALFTLATRLVAAQQPEQAPGPAHEAVDVYRQLIAIADNPQYQGFLAEAEQLADSLPAA